MNQPNFLTAPGPRVGGAVFAHEAEAQAYAKRYNLTTYRIAMYANDSLRSMFDTDVVFMVHAPMVGDEIDNLAVKS